MIEPIDRDVENELIDKIDPDKMEKHLDAFTGLKRVSGSEDEWQASEYVVDQLREYGVDAEINEYEGYISVPESASVTVTTPERVELDDVITVAFSASTPPDGVYGDVVWVDDLADLEGAAGSVQDRIVFAKGLPTPDAVRHAEFAGAKALVLESPTEGQIHEMIVSPVWGTPSAGEAGDLPDLPVVEVSQMDGRQLREQLAHGPVKATVAAQVTTKLRTLPCPVGRIDGTESDRYFIVGNHVDSWYEGITDNATAMAATLELARLFAEQEPKRGLVFGFWSAHSTGRYAGSAWYADTNWLDLRENGVAYLHIDLNGLLGADSLWYQHMAELGDEHIDAMRTATKFPLREGDDSWLGDSDRPARNSDQSFWGAGLSSLLSGARLTPGTTKGGPIGGGWWWHTPEDTRDKVDMDVLVEETKLYVALAARICESPVLPHDYTATVDDIKTVLDGLDSGTISFDPLYNDLAVLRTELTSAYDAVATGAETDHQLAAAFEDLQVELGNLLIPAVYMTRQEYEHEPKGPHRLLEELQPVVTSTEQGQRFAGISCQRGVTRLQHRVRRATRGTQEFRDQHATDGRGSRQHEA